MKKCQLCNESYGDDTLNFCLSCGGTLLKLSDDAPPTVFMNQARTTNQNWNPPANNPFSQPQNFGQMSPWQNQSPQMQNPSYLAAQHFQTPNQTLPTVSLILGILSVVFCCYGFPLGIGALITGFIGYNNANKEPMTYGGSGLAIAGMILGAISIFMLVVFVIIGAVG